MIDAISRGPGAQHQSLLRAAHNDLEVPAVQKHPHASIRQVPGLYATHPGTLLSRAHSSSPLHVLFFYHSLFYYCCTVQIFSASGLPTGFFFFFLRGSPRYYIGANRTLPSTHAIGYLGKPVRVGARRALPQEDNAIPKRSASMKAYHRKGTPSDGHVPSTRG